LKENISYEKRWEKRKKEKEKEEAINPWLYGELVSLRIEKKSMTINLARSLYLTLITLIKRCDGKKCLVVFLI
jgi:hypothetical protein